MSHFKFGRKIVAAIATLAVTCTPAFAESCRSLRGINLAGAEFGNALPGEYGRDYIYPSEETIAYFAAHGSSVVRLPFRWERLQKNLNVAFDVAELGRLKNTVKAINDRGMVAIIDPHNYARYHEGVIGSASVPNAAFADFWTRLATQFKSNNQVIFSLTNEPYEISARQWLRAANAGLAAIRGTGAEQLVLVPGVHYTGAHSWTENLAGGNNGRVMRGVRDPFDNFAFDFHQYLDKDYSGRHAECPRARQALTALRSVTRWLVRTDNRGFLGEFGASSNTRCLRGLQSMTEFVNQNSDRWIGWTYWAAGDWWPAEDMLSVQPIDSTRLRPQLKAIKPYLGRPECNIGKPLDLGLDSLRR